MVGLEGEGPVGGFRPVVVVLLCNERALLRVPGALVLALVVALVLVSWLVSVLVRVLLAAAVLEQRGLAELWLPTGGAPRLGFSTTGVPCLLFSVGLVPREEELRLLGNPLTGSLEPEGGAIAPADRTEQAI